MTRLRWSSALIALICLTSAADFSAAAVLVVSGTASTDKTLNASSHRAVTSDGAGGVFVAWHAEPYTCSPPNCRTRVSVQHLLASGAIAPGWNANGVRLTSDAIPGTHDETQAVVAADGAGGALVAWVDSRGTTGTHIYAQHVGANGQVAAGWPADGVALSGYAGLQEKNPVICPDASGGALVVWSDQSEHYLLAQHVTTTGSIAVGWPAPGLLICQAPPGHSKFDLCPDGSDGCYVAWEDTRSGSTADLYAQRILSDGTVAPGWVANGTPVSTAVGQQRVPRVCSDDAGGVIITWIDEHNGPYDIYAQHLLGTGDIAPGWTGGGIPLCEAMWNQWNPAIASDGSGGAVVAWYDTRDLSHAAIYATRVTGIGTNAPGWPIDGTFIATGPWDSYQQIVSDGQHGAIVEWSNQTGTQIYAERLDATGAVAPGWPIGGLVAATPVTPVSGGYPVSAVADSSGGLFLVWEDDLAPGDQRNDIVASRTTGAGQILLAVNPAHSARADISLASPQPNPSFGPLTLSFSLRDTGPAEIAVLDVSGRTLSRQELGRFGPGTHHLTFTPAHLPAGVYWLRLSQGDQSVTRRAAILR